MRRRSFIHAALSAPAVIPASRLVRLSTPAPTAPPPSVLLYRPVDHHPAAGTLHYDVVNDRASVWTGAAWKQVS